MALNLFGVTVNDAQTIQLEVANTELITVRDLAAICGQADHRGAQPDDAAVTRYAAVVSGYAAVGPVLPAPVGVEFSSKDSVKRWLELHYGALTEALTFVENRVAARVHIRPDAPMDRDVGLDAATAAAETVRALRRSVVATLPLRVDKTTGVLQSVAYLVDRDSWTDFVREVDAQIKLSNTVHIDLTGPWPPYDFVQMQLGA